MKRSKRFAELLRRDNTMTDSLNQENGSINLTSTKHKVLAISEVAVVRYVLYSLLALGFLYFIYGSFNPDSFPVEAAFLVGSLWFIVPAIMIIGFRRNLRDYGLSLKHGVQSVDLALSALPFFVLTGVGFMIVIMIGWSYIEAPGALLMTGFFAVSLVLIVWTINKKYSNFDEIQIPKRTHHINIFAILILLLFPIILGVFLGRLSDALIFTVVWQFIFSGFGEEIFFRGYIQSRLNLAFGRPYEWKGIKFGVGLFITAGLFAFTHILNTANMWLGDFTMAWWWGTFTFVGGLLFGLLREKTGSIVASGTLHGLESIGEGLALLF